MIEPSVRPGFINAQMERPEEDEAGSINSRDTAAVRARYAVCRAEQSLSARTREAYLAAVTAFGVARGA